MKQRYWIFKRGRVWYLEDSETGKQTSLHTTDREQAEQLLQTKLQADRQPWLNVAMAKTLLAAADPKIPQRTWQVVMDEFIARSGCESTRLRREQALTSNTFDSLRNKPIISTNADELRAVLASAGAFANNCLRCLHNLAIGMGWLPWPIIPSKLWPATKPGDKRAITWEEHQRIIEREQNPERRLYYEILWELGASQTDAAQLTAENVDWQTRTLTYERQKTGELATVSIGSRLQELLSQFHSTGPLFPQIGPTSRADSDALLHRGSAAATQEKDI